MVESIKRILIVDDELEFVKTLQRHLKREGFSLDLAHNGKNACQKIQVSCNNDVPFDLVITDLVMPNMNGIQLLQWIKNNHPELSVLLVSGYGNFNSGVVKETIRTEMDDYGDKPLTPQELMALIKRIDHKRKSSLAIKEKGSNKKAGA